MFDVDIGDGQPIRKLPYNQSGMLIFVSINNSGISSRFFVLHR